MEHRTIHIALLHRNKLYRESLGCCLAQRPSFIITGSAPSVEELVAVLGPERTDIVIVEYGLLRRDGIANAEKICTLSSALKTLVIDVPESDDEILYCIEMGGASGYLLNSASIEDLVNNARAIIRGETICSPRIAHLSFCRISRLAHRREEFRNANGVYLTRRETEVVRLIEDGLSNKEIATRLHIEVSTVKNHVHNILDKLQLHSRHSAVNYIKEQSLAVPRF